MAEGNNCRVIGSFRVNKDKKSIMVFRIQAITKDAELHSHALEVEVAKLKIKQLKDKENSAVYGNPPPQSGLSNSMMDGGGGPAGAGIGGPGGPSFGNAKHDTVYKMVCGCDREEGIGKDELIGSLKGKIGASDVAASLDYLSGEGHIYSTIDDDHYKAIE